MKFKDMPYHRVVYEEAEKEYRQLIEDFRAAGSGEEQFKVHERYYALNDRIGTMMTIAHIRHDIDTADEFYNGEKDYYDEIQPKLANLTVEYQQEMYHSPYRSYLEKKIGKVAFKNMELQMKSFDERLIPLMQEENALTTRYDKLIAAAKIEWEGDTLNLSLLRPYLTSSDRNIRKKAYEKYSAFFASIAEELDEIYDKLVKNRTEQARQMGYENYVELGYYRMNRNCYDKEMVENYRRQIKEYFVPFAEKMHERRRKRLGLDKLSYIDAGVYFREGNPTPVGNPEEIVQAGRQMYSEMSPETGEFFAFMMENQLFDVLGRKTKRAGGYMTFLPEYGAPFIFANFNGTSGDVDVITHECGHAFQEKIRYRNIGISQWKQRKFIPCPWNFLRKNGWICFSATEPEITEICIWKMRRHLSLMDVWWMNFSIQYMKIPGCHRWREKRHGWNWRRYIALIWIMEKMNFLPKAVSGRNSIIFMIFRFTILITALPRLVLFNIKL